MNHYRITALEDVDVFVSDDHTATILVRGVPRPVTTRSTPYWKHLSQGEACEVAALHGIRGDFFEESTVNLPAESTAPVVVHEALRIEELPSHDLLQDTRPLQPPTPPNR